MQTKILLQVKGAAVKITLEGQAQNRTTPLYLYVRTYGHPGPIVEAFALTEVSSSTRNALCLHPQSELSILQALASGGTPFPSPPRGPMICDHHLLSTYYVPGTIPRACHSSTHTSPRSLWGKHLNTCELRPRGRGARKMAS